MTPEENLKRYIINRYGTVKNFTLKHNIPYGTMTSVFLRGINNTTIHTLGRISEALSIDPNELMNGKIVETYTQPKPIEALKESIGKIDYDPDSYDTIMKCITDYVVHYHMANDGVDMSDIGDELNRELKMIVNLNVAKKKE